MADEERHEAIRKAVKERIKQSEELQLTQMITDAIGERRYRDLKDLISQLEQDQGWLIALEHLSKSRELTYNLPLGIASSKTLLEELKFRETIFALLECEGFEPIPLTTDEIISNLKSADSLIEASSFFFAECTSLAIKQIESGDSLFYNLNQIGSSIPSNIINLLEETQHNEITMLSLLKHGDVINVFPLWYSEKGRQTLAYLGIKGGAIDSSTFDIVLSVLQLSIQDIIFTENRIKTEAISPPSNSLYKRLLTSIIHHDIEGLMLLSSKYSYDTLKFMLDDAIDYYATSPLSSNFRNIISCINAHIRVRTSESIIPLEELTQMKDIRIATTAITALGNFYNESATTALVDLLCETKKNEIANTAIKAITNISKRCMETKYIIKNAIDSQSCTNIGRIKRLYKQIWNVSDDY